MIEPSFVRWVEGASLTKWRMKELGRPPEFKLNNHVNSAHKGIFDKECPACKELMQQIGDRA